MIFHLQCNDRLKKKKTYIKRFKEVKCFNVATFLSQVFLHNSAPHPLQANMKLIYLFVDDTGGWLFVALAKLLVLILPSEGHHVLLKDVASLWGVSKILHMVKEA